MVTDSVSVGSVHCFLHFVEVTTLSYMCGGIINKLLCGFAFKDMVEFAKHYDCWHRTVTNKRTDKLSAAMADNAVLIDQGRAHEIKFQTNIGARPAVMLPKPRLEPGKDSVMRATIVMMDIYKEINRDKEASENLLCRE